MNAGIGRRRTFCVLVLLLIAANAFDLWTTIRLSPDLAEETNYLFALFGGGLGDWHILILVKLGMAILAVIAMALGNHRIAELHPSAPDMGWGAFVGYLHFGVRVPFHAALYKWSPPKRWSKFAGLVLAVVLIVVSAAAGVSNLAGLITSDTAIYVFYASTTILSLVAAYFWLWRDYRAALKGV